MRVGRDVHVNTLLLANRGLDALDAICQEHGITHAQYVALWTLCLGDDPDAGIPTGTVADGLLNRAADATRLIDRMERAGLVERMPNPADRRSVLVRATPLGRDAFAAVTSRAAGVPPPAVGEPHGRRDRHAQRVAGEGAVGRRMSTDVVLTGTGVPHPRPGTRGRGHAGAQRRRRPAVRRRPRHGPAPDGGRDTASTSSTALFLTHVHSDHVVGLADLVMTRWIERQVAAAGPLAARRARGRAGPLRPPDARCLRRGPRAACRARRRGPDRARRPPFEVPATPAEVWTSEDGTVRVRVVGVHHEPVREAVAYRVETPDGVVVVSGDTRVCDEVEDLAAGADVLVHEACRTSALAP